jgi:D-cysteine desulfhydrase
MSNYLADSFPLLAARLQRVPLAELPTPVSTVRVRTRSGHHDVTIKHDNLTGAEYGGNKVRKLEYVFQRANHRRAKRLATFGTVASNHAIATALYARQQGLACTCFLSHQTRTANAERALRFHMQNGTELVRYGGDRGERRRTLRHYLHGRRAWLIPLGGSSWLGSVGFVNAGLELAAQITAGEIECPERIYVALGTMGTAAGLALGLALAGLDIETHAVRVTDKLYANQHELERLLRKTATLMHTMDPAIPSDLATRTRIVIRDDFFAGGYAHSNEVTQSAIDFAHEQMALELEPTYTGKTMAALIYDLNHGFRGPLLFWNTYNSRALPVGEDAEQDFDALPKEFARYFA